MTTSERKAGIYLITEFDWPAPFEDEHGTLAGELHRSLQGHEWVKEICAASGGIGGDMSSIWIIWLANYAALDRLLKDPSDPVSRAYNAFFSRMAAVQDRVREEVLFLTAE